MSTVSCQITPNTTVGTESFDEVDSAHAGPPNKERHEGTEENEKIILLPQLANNPMKQQ